MKMSIKHRQEFLQPVGAAQFKAAGLTYPLTVRFTGILLEQADPAATAKYIFDAGSNPQPRSNLGH